MSFRLLNPPIFGKFLLFSRTGYRRLYHDSVSATEPSLLTQSELLQLPALCPGCGAYAQTIHSDEPGFYDIKRKSVKSFVEQCYGDRSDYRSEDSTILSRVLDAKDDSMIPLLGTGITENGGSRRRKSSSLVVVANENVLLGGIQDIPNPVCNRCHSLEHHHSGVPVSHPTIRSLREVIGESPHKYNHIYHIIDAADFPLSLIPSLQKTLSLSPQRSQNRRAKSNHYQYGRKMEMSFIITRSDLLAPRKEQVDGLMPYLLEVLRNTLGGSAENARLGNVHCVSSKRGWWTKQVKQRIWERGGGGWMVGKVNVGKSCLLENIYPKGCTEKGKDDLLSTGQMKGLDRKIPENRHQKLSGNAKNGDNEQIPGDSLLPPAPLEKPFPVLPLVSALPGTTASPIRLPFGNGKGELVDLPGLSRDGLEACVVDNHKMDLVMSHRVRPEQYTIKPGQSLLLGGLVRITPLIPDVTVLAYPFVPLKSHVASTSRVIALHTQKETSEVSRIAKPGCGGCMLPAGIFSLKWDVTRQRSGPLTKKAAAGLSTNTLPFLIFSADVLIEGCGWVELVAQVRKRQFDNAIEPDDIFDNTPYPRVEVASPYGRHVGLRQPMGAWSFCDQRPGIKAARPRQSMKGVKKRLKRSAKLM